MGILQNLVKSMSKDKVEFKARYKEAEMQDKIERTLVERAKSSNERELENYMKREREDKIKKELDVIHHQQTKDNWCSNSLIKSQTNILKGKNMFKHDKKYNILKGRLF